MLVYQRVPHFQTNPGQRSWPPRHEFRFCVALCNGRSRNFLFDSWRVMEGFCRVARERGRGKMDGLGRKWGNACGLCFHSRAPRNTILFDCVACTGHGSYGQLMSDILGKYGGSWESATFEWLLLPFWSNASTSSLTSFCSCSTNTSKLPKNSCCRPHVSFFLQHQPLY